MARPFKRKDSKFWWIAPVIQGKQRPQSSRTTDYDRACAKLKILEGQLAAGAPIQPGTDRKDFAALLELVRTDHAIQKRRAIKDLIRRIDKHIAPAIGHLPSKDVGPLLPEYIKLRQNEGAANGSIIQELAIVRRAFTLAKERDLVLAIPTIPHLEPAQPRNTAYTDKQLDTVIRKADALVSDLLTIYSFTGWRKKSVLLIEWSQVDFAEGFLTGFQTKNQKPTKFPLIAPLLEIFQRRKQLTDEVQRRKGCVIPWVFHRNGRRVKDFRKAFDNTRKASGLPGHRIHDFRRTAVRALHDAGYDVKTIMDMCGFKTESMVHHYIGMTSDDRLKAAGAALAKRRGYHSA